MEGIKIVFRVDQDNEEEYNAAKDVFGDRVTRFRSDTQQGDLVIPRYSCLPFYQDFEDEVKNRGGHLLNTWAQHSFVADMEWYRFLKNMTPKTWTDVGYATVPDTEHGYVVKGKTNSRKFKWATHMFARDRKALKDVMGRLYDDSLLSSQGLVVREYIPLRQIEEGINGMPVTNEWRCFFIDDTLLASGFYWSMAECAEEMGTIPEDALALAKRAALELEGSKVRGFVVDVGETAQGDWIVIEVNDFQMSGLSMIDPFEFYTSLQEHFLGVTT